MVLFKKWREARKEKKEEKEFYLNLYRTGLERANEYWLTERFDAAATYFRKTIKWYEEAFPVRNKAQIKWLEQLKRNAEACAKHLPKG